MKILLTLFVLLFSSSVFAELPTSLFGVELNAKVEEYKEDDIKINEDKYLCNKQKKPDQKSSGEIKGYTSESIEIKFMKNHPLFDSQCIGFNNAESLITKISGSTSWMFWNDLEEGNINKFGLEEQIQNHLEIIDTLSKLYDINFRKFDDYYFYDQREYSSDDGTKYSPQTLTLLHILDFKIQNEKLQLILYSHLNKMKDSELPKNNLNNLIGSGFFYITLQNEQSDEYNETKNLIENLKDKQIKKKDISKYVEIMKSLSSSF
ncbi:MAG: hypothetical protein ACJ0RE_05160 [Alphaproteobacteria bacterium]